VRVLPADETATLRALVHTAFRRPQDARAELAKARTGGAALAESHVVEGLLLERDKSPTEATAAFAKAVELKSQNFYAHYRVAVDLVRPGGPGDRAGAERNYRQAIALNPAFAPAHKMLASLLASGPIPELAFESARQAATLDPADSNTRLVYAYVLRRMGQIAAANGQALAARTLAGTDAERQQAQQMVDEIAATMAKTAPAK
jgi:tetratricopeptide (TPR) repeat protein